MDQIIVAMSGRKQAGKNTLGQYIRRYYVEQKCSVKSVFSSAQLDDHTTECSFADNLKEFCIDTLGLPYEACYGTDDEKRAPTQYSWDDVPKFLRWKFADPRAKKLVAQGKSQDLLMDAYYNAQLSQVAQTQGLDLPMHLQLAEPLLQKGAMSGRDIMQLFGTDLIRQTFGNVWANATIRRIKKARKPFSVITDNRFPNEVEAVLAEPKGYIIRLTRSPFGTNDVHPSESALDGFDWDRDRCFVLDNAAMTLTEQEQAIKPIIDQVLA